MKETDYLDRYLEKLPCHKIIELRVQRRKTLLDPAFRDSYRTIEENLPQFSKAIDLRIENGCIIVGDEALLSEKDRACMSQAVKNLLPWRKGPIKLFGIQIDAEWRSNLKWDRISKYLDPISDKRVLDIGCNNGYYLFRMAEHKPALALGIDPGPRFFLQFQLLQRYIQNQTVAFELFGIEDLDLFAEFFHTVFCMGVLYHNRSPLLALQNIHSSLLSGGQLILESMAIPGEDPISLSPPDRYGKMRNVWFIPTANCLTAWLRLSGFVDINIISSVLLTADEQQKTELAPWESLSDYLDPSDPTKTVEGYPAPLRVALAARKK